MNVKLVIIGAIAFWLAWNVVAFGTGLVIHEGILKSAYLETASFWVPELRQEPPDMAALIPYWFAMSFLLSLVVAGIYGCVVSVFNGPGWKRGMTWGLCVAILYFAIILNHSGVFDLPMTIWGWWGIDALILCVISGAAMGWADERFAGG